jgi:hypothetical protein
MGSIARAGLLAIGVLAVGVGAAGPAVAQGGGAVVISGPKYEVKETDDGWSTSVEVSNGTASDVTIVMALVGEESCTIAADPATLDASTAATIEFQLDDVSAIDDDTKTVQLELTASAGGDDVFSRVIDATIAEDEPTTYRPLWGYVVGIGFALVLMVVVAVRAPIWEPEKETEAPWHKRLRAGLWRPLPSLPDDWSFTDSWATNAALAASIFTGVFGATDVLESIFGDEGESIVNVATVAAAMTIALVAAAPLLVTALRTSPDGKADTDATVAGLLVGSWLVVAATTGQVATAAWLLHDVDGVSDALVVSLAVIALVVLAVYALRSIPATIAFGLYVAPKKSKRKPSKRTVTIETVPGAPVLTDEDDDAVFVPARRRAVLP